MKTNRLMMIAVLIGMAMGVSAQSESKYGADSVACITNMSMYREYFKQWKAANYAAESFSMEMVNAWRAANTLIPMVRRLWTTSSPPMLIRKMPISTLSA